MRMLFSSLIGLCSVLSFSAFGDIATVASVDMSKYVGRWYVIQENPSDMRAGCFCSQHTLTAQEDKTFAVYNSCNLTKVDGPLFEIHGVASVDDANSNAKLTIDFGSSMTGKYWVIALDKDYTWAVVSEPTGKGLFILSKTPTLADDKLAAAVAEAGKQLDVTALKPVVQDGCVYPEMK